MTDLLVQEKFAQWQRLKKLVLDSVFSPITRRVYRMALDEFRTGSAWRLEHVARITKQVKLRC